MASENELSHWSFQSESDNDVFPVFLLVIDLDSLSDTCNLEDRPNAKKRLLGLPLITEEI